MLPPNLKGLTLSELQAFAELLGEKKYRGTQLYSWLYAKNASSFAEMTDISKSFRDMLEQSARLENLQVAAHSKSSQDGTTKFLFKLSDGMNIESVLIPPERTSPNAEKRLTICVSTQVGCPLDCKFCATGTMGFLRNLSVGEIVDQVLQAQKLSPRRITNIVFMGMGEPMLNYENVMTAVDIFLDERGLNFSWKHVTLSTAGYANRIRQVADEDRKVKLALSLHTLDPAKRLELMPITKKYSVDELMDAMEYYYRKTKRRPTFEYIPFEGFNDGGEDVRRLVAISGRFPIKVNLIPFHAIAFAHPSGIGATLKPTPRARMEWFAEKLREENITVMIRSSSGEDIQAACGQLAVEHPTTP
jgi:23S rRNA (adenine2503-C2)-methyltransferase